MLAQRDLVPNGSATAKALNYQRTRRFFMVQVVIVATHVDAIENINRFSSIRQPQPSASKTLQNA